MCVVCQNVLSVFYSLWKIHKIFDAFLKNNEQRLILLDLNTTDIQGLIESPDNKLATSQ